jgi:two-component system LytT family sensor kinase
MTRRPLADLLGMTFTIVVVWLVVAVFNLSEFHQSAAATGSHVVVRDVLAFQIVSSLTWALFTPLIAFWAERLSLRSTRRWLNLTLLLLSIPVIAVLRAVWGSAVLQLSEGDAVTFEMARYSVEIRTVRYMFIVAIIIGITKLMDLYRDADVHERRALALQAEVANTEAEHLRAQTQPSFMFGTLQAIRAAVRTDPATADRMLVTLGEILRRGLDRAREGDTTLEEELDFADRYLELQRIRFAVPLSVTVDVDDELLAARVPTLAMQTLIEAAVDNSPPSRVRVSGRLHQGRLQLEARVAPAILLQLEQRSMRIQQWFGPEHRAGLRLDGESIVAAVELPLRYSEEVAA